MSEPTEKSYTLVLEYSPGASGNTIINEDNDTVMDKMLERFVQRIRDLEMPESNTEPYVKVKSLTAQ